MAAVPKATVSGTIFRYGTKERISFATVKATISQGEKLERNQELANDDGDFSLHGDIGEWSIVAFSEDSFPNAPIEVKPDGVNEIKDLKIYLQPLAGLNDKAAGLNFFKWLLIIFGSLVIVYLVVHFIFSSKATGGSSSFAIWDEDPWRYAEILLWGMAGVLVNKIITTSWYLRSNRYYQEGTIMHIAHLVATPLLVFVAVAILSLATLNITVAESTLKLEMTKATVLVAVSFLLGTIPWPLWHYIENSAKKITEQKS